MNLFLHVSSPVKGVLAGMMISLGATAFLKVGGIAGAVLFAVGLLGVVTYKYNLFTGKAGFLEISPFGMLELSSILFWNVVGVYFTAMCAAHLYPELADKCSAMIHIRESAGLFNTFIASVGCGIMMSLAISGVKSGNFIPLIFAVPCFILAGFYHCVADAFYFFLSGDNIFEYSPIWTTTVAGNWVGCNIQRLNETK